MKKIIPVPVIISAFLAITGLFTSHIYAIMYANHSCRAYNVLGILKSPEGPGIDSLIIEGAGYFLESHGYFSQLLNKAELSEINGPDYPALQSLVYQALDNMEKANTTYKKLVTAAEDTPYNPDIISQLMQFPYEKFQENQGLNPQVFSRIRTFLEKGDVTGLYVLLYEDMEFITYQLKTLKTTLDAGTFPGSSLLWRLNQTYFESMLSGQYTAEVFNTL